MPRSRLKRRELMLLGVPTLAIIGAAVFLSRRQAVREQNRSGPYRAAITRVEVLPVTPFEAWQGFDTKIVVYAADSGQLTAPTGARLAANRVLLSSPKVMLTGQINGQPRDVTVSSVKSEWMQVEPLNPGPLQVRPENMGTPDEQPEKSLTFLAATSRFDANTSVRLHGQIWFARNAFVPPPAISAPPGWKVELARNGVLQAQTQSATLDQSLPRIAGVNVDRTAPQVQVKSEARSPIYVQTDPLGDNGSGLVHLSFPRASFSNSVPRLHCTTPLFFDEKNCPVQLPPDELPHWDGAGKAIMRLHIEQVPPLRGSLKMKMWLALGDGWPTLIQTEVRPAWTLKRPQLLQVENVEVQGGDVIVNVRYTGTKSLSERDSLGFYDSRDDFYQRITPQPNVDRLYSNWSQHYTLPNGKSYWYRNVVSVKSVDCDATNHCQVVYTTNVLTALKKGQRARFSAHIGIEGDGLIPINASIVR